MARKSKINFDEQLVIDVCATSNSMSDAARRLGVKFSTLKRIALKLGCYKPNQNSRSAGYVPRRITIDDLKLYYFSNVKYISAAKLRQVLIREGVKDARCEICNSVQWLGKPIPLELHHKDGNHYNNSLDNLTILCPTCHAWLTDNSNLSMKSNSRSVCTALGQAYTPTPTVKAEKDKRIKSKSRHRESCKLEHVCPSCGKQYMTNNSKQKYCSHACVNKTYRKFDPTAEILLGMFREEANYTKIAEKLGVSDNAVKKRCKVLGIYDEVKTLVTEEKRRRAIKNQCSQSREFRQASAVKSKVTVNRNMDYYVGYTVVNGAEVELVRFENTEQLRNAGYSDSVVQRVCLGKAKTYKGWLWRREPKVPCSLP